MDAIPPKHLSGPADSLCAAVGLHSGRERSMLSAVRKVRCFFLVGVNSGRDNAGADAARLS